MTTVGRGLNAQVFEFFEGLRTFDAARAAAVLSEDATVQLPWHEGTLQGREAAEAFLKEFLGDAVGRPSLSIVAAKGEGGLVEMTLSESGRFGRDSRLRHLRAVAVQGALHHVEMA